MARLFDFCQPLSTEPPAFTAAGMWRRLVIPASPPSRPGFFWLELPSDVAEIIIRHMSRRTLRALSQCCRSHAKAVRQEEWAATGDDNDLFLLRLAVAGYAVLRSALPAVTSRELAALKRRPSKPVFNAYDSEQKSTAVGDGKRRVVELKLQDRPDLSLELSSAYARALRARGALAAAAMGEDKYTRASPATRPPAHPRVASVARWAGTWRVLWACWRRPTVRCSRRTATTRSPTLSSPCPRATCRSPCSTPWRTGPR